MLFMNRKSLALLAGACSSILFAAHAPAQPVVDRPRLQRDMEIMEMVLDRLLNQEAAPLIRLGGRAARGVYLPDFGVLFQVPQTGPRVDYFEFHTGQPAGGFAGHGISSAGQMETSADAAEDELMDFFCRYADAIGQLRPSDRIAVYRSAGPELAIFFSFPDMANKHVESTGQELLAWVNKADLDAVQTGKIGAAELRNRVHLSDPENRTAAERDAQDEIDTLGGVLEIALGLPRGTTSGTYLEGYGVVLFTRADFNASWPRHGWAGRTGSPAQTQGVAEGHGMNVSAPQAIEDYLRATELAKRERTQNWQGEYQKFKERMLTALADYAHTVHLSQPQHRLVVVADLQNALEMHPHQLVCTLQRQQVEQYQRQKISREQLRQAVTIYEN